MALFPGAIPAFTGFTSGHTLFADVHASQHNLEQAEIVNIATKVGTGASTPTSGMVLRGNGVGTSAWGQAVLTTDVSGTLPIANGGIGQNTLTGLPLLNPALTGTVTGGATYTSPILTTPTISDYTNATHTHATVAQGGLLNGANAITDGTITPAELTSGTGSSWITQGSTPVLTGFSADPASAVYKYIQIGKIVHLFISQPNNGTSNATGFSITLPVAARDLGVNIYSGMGQGIDNGGVLSTPVLLLINTGSPTILTLYPSFIGGTWTASGGKRLVFGTITYEAA